MPKRDLAMCYHIGSNLKYKLYEYSKKPYETGVVSKTSGSGMFKRQF